MIDGIIELLLWEDQHGHGGTQTIKAGLQTATVSSRIHKIPERTLFFRRFPETSVSLFCSKQPFFLRICPVSIRLLLYAGG
jgi:hypothetical protein